MREKALLEQTVSWIVITARYLLDQLKLEGVQFQDFEQNFMNIWMR
jgi:hypothetical protein